jgi:hypothetical protein
MSNRMLKQSKVLECVCGAHYYKFTLCEFEQGNPEIYIEFLNSAQHATWGRLRWAWHILRTGYTSNAGIALTLADRDVLVDALNEPDVWSESFYTSIEREEC